MVFFVIVFLIFWGSIQRVFGLMSTKIGIPPLCKIALAVDTKLNEGNITSLFFIPQTDKARFNAAVPLFTEIQVLELTNFLNY